MASSKPDSNIQKVTLDLPRKLMTIVDAQCKEAYITRKKWFFDAMNIKIKEEELKLRENNKSAKSSRY